ncbi:MAG: hypothetical protein R2807_07155 [Chitinophagales bacterium]
MEIVFLLLCSFLAFYVLLLCSVSFASIGAIAIGFCTVNFVNLDVSTYQAKVITIAMFLPLFTSVWLIFQKKYILGTILCLVFAYEIISGAHVQIAYYSFMLIGIFILIEFVRPSAKKI